MKVEKFKADNNLHLNEDNTINRYRADKRLEKWKKGLQEVEDRIEVNTEIKELLEPKKTSWWKKFFKKSSE